MLRYLITGANRGIGLAFTKQLLNRGDAVLACCRNPEAAHALNELALQRSDDNLVILELDVTKQAMIETLPKLLEQKGITVDVLILNAGITDASEQLGTLEGETMLKILHTNAIAPMLLVQAFSKHLQTLKHISKIICISSDLGSITHASDLTFGMSYGMSKAALNMGVKKLSSVLSRRNTSIISIHPGWVQTDMGGVNATLTPITSVQSMLKVIDNLSIAETGSFLDFKGRIIPW